MPSSVAKFGPLMFATVTACSAGPLGPPLRPGGPEVMPPQAATFGECTVTTPADEDAARTYENRDVGAANKQLTAARANLAASDDAGASIALTAALAADPYHVGATYALAQVQARAGRPQCAANLLARIVLLRGLHTRQKDADAALSTFRTGDPAFASYADDERFEPFR